MNDLEYIVDVSYASKVITFEAALQEARHFNEYAYKSIRCIVQDNPWQYTAWPPTYAREHYYERDPSYIDRDPLPSLEYGHGIIIGSNTLPPGDYGMELRGRILYIDSGTINRPPIVLRISRRFLGATPSFNSPYLIAQWDKERNVIYRRTHGMHLAAYKVPNTQEGFALVPHEHKWLYEAALGEDEDQDRYIHLRPRKWPPEIDIADIPLDPEEDFKAPEDVAGKQADIADLSVDPPLGLWDSPEPGLLDSPEPGLWSPRPLGPLDSLESGLLDSPLNEGNQQSAEEWAAGVFN